LFISGRADEVIISGAAKMHPEAVETVLSGHPDVQDVVVVGVPGRDLGQRVHAVIELAPHAAGDSEARLRAWCRVRLAPESRPRSYQFVAAVPRSAAGKVRRATIAHLAANPTAGDADAN
jgi:acyl-CoA synthetase (AMP-forming)/AMP-acid ligase II